MKKDKLSKSVCAILTSIVLPVNTFSTVPLKTIQNIVSKKSEIKVSENSENISLNTIEATQSMNLYCKNETDTTAEIAWTDIFSNEEGAYEIYLNNILVESEICDNSYIISGLKPASEYEIVVKARASSGEIIESSDNLSITTDLIITQDTALLKETTANNVYVKNGTLNLNGQSLHVKGNMVISRGTFSVNGGNIDISGDLRIQTENIDSNGNKSYSKSYGYLNMTNEDDYVKVNKNFIMDSYYSHDGILTEGILEIKGDFTQLSSNSSNFHSSKNHKTVLTGDKLQTVNINNMNSKFATLELQNFSDDGIEFTNIFNVDNFIKNGCNIRFSNEGELGWQLNDDEIYNGNLNLIGNTLDLNGHKLTVNGDLLQSGGIINVNGGELVVTGDYKIQTSSEGTSSGSLNMTNEADKVTINGSFVTRSNVDHSKLLTAGTMKIGGNLYQYDNSRYNFKTSDKHIVILNGTQKQTVSFESCYDGDRARFNILKIENTSDEGVYFATSTWVQKELYDTDSVVAGSARLYLSGSGELADNKWSYDLNVNQNKKLNYDWTIGGSLYISGGTFDLNGKSLKSGKDIGVSYGTLYINGGQLDIGNDLRIQYLNVQDDGTVKYSSSCYGKLQMTNENDFVKVNRNFIMYSSSSHNGNLTNGTLEVKGNFSQYSGDSNNFRATDEHKVILSGTEKQTISLQSPNARFSNLEIINTSDEGIYVSSYFNADNIVDENKKLQFEDGKRTGWKLEKDESIEGFELIYDTLDLNGHKLTVNGDLLQSGGI
ncbi:MAG: fibronectin type III domain-containing protein, partial [Ruminococcus flavefaciens]|nr:fibronectin type III domain-containing protein [Ruminococcus flavefaciens]